MHLAEARLLRDGFCHLPAALTAPAMEQLLALEDAIVQAAAQQSGQGETVGFLHRQIPELTTLFTNPTLLARLARHAGCPASRIKLLGTTLYRKPPGISGTAWHQDGRFIPSDGLQAITLWVPLQAVNADMAPLVFMAGSQRQCLIEQPLPSALWPPGLERETAVLAAPLALGDATVHQLWTLHGSLANTGQQERLALIVNYLTAPLQLNARTEAGGRGPSAALINRLRRMNHEVLQHHGH